MGIIQYTNFCQYPKKSVVISNTAWNFRGAIYTYFKNARQGRKILGSGEGPAAGRKQIPYPLST